MTIGRDIKESLLKSDSATKKGGEESIKIRQDAEKKDRKKNCEC